MSQNGFRLEASDWEKMVQACFPAALQNLWAPQTGRHSGFSSEGSGPHFWLFGAFFWAKALGFNFGYFMPVFR